MDARRRKDLIRQYRESHRPTGVYALRNGAEGKLWVGSSVNLPATFNKLRMQLDTGSFLMAPELQRDWKRLGADAFSFEVLEELEPPDAPDWDPGPDLEAALELWLEQLEPWGERGYHRPPASGDG